MSEIEQNAQNPAAQLTEFQDQIEILERSKISLENEVKMLQEHRDMLQSMLQDSPEPLVCYDAQENVIFVNSAFSKTFGWTLFELKGKPLNNVPPELTFETTIIRDKRSRGEGIPVFETKRLTKDGKILDVKMSSSVIENSRRETVGHAVTILDISERKRMERALKLSEEKYRLMTEQLNDVLWSINFDLKTTFVSRSVERVLGFTPEERIHKDSRDQLTPESLNRALKVLSEELENDLKPGVDPDRAIVVELDHIHKNGSIVTLESKLSFIRDDKGFPVAIHGLSRDITDRKRADQKLSEAQKKLIIRNLIAGTLLNSPKGEVYSDILDILLDVMKSKCGFIGYIDENNRMLCPSMSKGTWESCNIPHKATVFPREKWSGILGGALQEKKTQIANDSLDLPVGHVQLKRAIVVPMMHDGNLVGCITLADKDEDYNLQDTELLEDIAEYLGPIMVTLWEREREETARRQAEENLRQSEERYRQITENSLTGIFIHRNGIIVYANPNLAEMLGYQQEEMLGRNILEAIDPKEREIMWRRAFSRLNGENPPSRYEINLIKKSGDGVACEILASLIKFEGQPAILGNVLDVTHRKKMERELRESESRYDTFLNSTTDLAYLKDESFRFLMVNKALQDYFGKPKSEILGKSDYEIVPKEAADVFRASDLQVLKNGRTIVVDEEVNGRIFESRKFLVPLENGGTAIGGLIRDVTERKQAEIALQERERAWAVLVDNLPGFVYRSSNDAEWTMEYISEGCKAITGYNPDEIMNKHPHSFNDIIDPTYQDHLWNKWQEVILKKGFFEDEYPIIHRNGQTRWIWERGQGVYGDDGQLLFLEGFITEITARKSVENALKESEDRYRVLVENLNDVIFSIDLEGKVTYVSPVIESKSKYKCEEIIGRKFLDFVHPDDLPQLFEKYTRVIEGNLEASEYRLRDKDGRMIHVSSYSRPLFQDGKLIGITGLLTDISERKRAEQALKKSEDLLKLTLEAINDGIWDLHINSNESYFSPRCYTMLGFVPNEFHGDLNSWRNRIHSDDLQTMDRNLKDHVEHGTDGFSAEIRMKTKSEDWRWFLLRGKVIEWNTHKRPARVVGILSDITDRKKTEEALIESEERYRTVADFNYDWECWADSEGRLLYVSPSSERITGYSAQEFIDDPGLTTRIVHPDDQMRVIEHFMLARGSDDDQSYDLDFRIIHRNESIRWISHACRPVYGREGQPLGRRASNRDITERKNLEQQIAHVQKMESIGTLAGGIAHDFNNLLQVTMGYSDLLLSGKAKHDPERSDLEKIHQAAQSGAELVRKLMTFSRKTEPAPEPINLNDEVKHVEELLRRTITKMIDIRLDLAPDLERTNADRSQIEQIIMNLAVNARDAINESGVLVIATENVFLDQDFCRRNLGAKPGRYVHLSVSDNGHGMDPEIVRHIFEPFYTTKELGRGTGLGLPMVYGIVKQHSGYITCSSQLGKGTVFDIYFPVIDAKTLDRKDQLTEFSISGTETILLVEDEPLVRELGERILQTNGYRVISVSNGEEALEIFSNDRTITLTILDLIMPGMGGKDCLKKMLQMNPNAQILIATGYSGETSVGDCLDLGAAGFVFKPFRSRELLTEIRKILDKKYPVFRLK